jgi:hypothetical protein
MSARNASRITMLCAQLRVALNIGYLQSGRMAGPDPASAGVKLGFRNRVKQAVRLIDWMRKLLSHTGKAIWFAVASE